MTEQIDSVEDSVIILRKCPICGGRTHKQEPQGFWDSLFNPRTSVIWWCENDRKHCWTAGISSDFNDY